MKGCQQLFGGLFAAFIFIGMGVAFLALNWGEFNTYRSSSNWTTTRGAVINGTIEYSTDSDGETTYRARITYFYYVGDQQYTGDRIKFGDDIYTGSQGASQNVIDRYPPETELIVYYDPNQPEEAVVERSLTNGLKAFLGVSLCLVSLGVLALLWIPFQLLRGR